MKRYGFKFYPLNGADTNSIDLRFAAFILAFIVWVISLATTAIGTSGMYASTAILFFSFGCVSELFPRALAVVVFISSVSLIIFVAYDSLDKVGECYENCRSYYHQKGLESKLYTALDVAALNVVYIVYNALISVIAYRCIKNHV